MKKSPTNFIVAKRIAVAVATVFATMSVPAAAADDMKTLMDLLLKKGVITQQEYDQNIKAAEDAAEDKAFKEKRLDDDVSKANKFIQKNADAGQVMKSGLGIQSADGKSSIELTGRIHMDYRGYDDVSYQDKFEIRRARLGVKGKFAGDWKYEIMGNYGAAAGGGLSSSSTEIDVAYIDYAANPAAQLRFGKFKMPFSLEQLTSSNNIDFMERSLIGQVEGELIPGKEVGLMVFGSPQSGVTYALAASQGRGNKTAAASSPDMVGRVTANFGEITGNKDLVVHTGLGYSFGGLKSGMVAADYASGRTESREADKYFTPAAGLTGLVDRTRMGAELAVAYQGLKLQGEYFDFKYDDTTSVDKKINGYYAQALWNITGESHAYSNSSGTFGFIKPNKPFGKGDGIGAWQVGVRFSRFDATNIAAATGKSNEVDALTLGMTWFVNDNTRVLLNYSETDFGTAISGVSKQRAMMLRGQVSF